MKTIKRAVRFTLKWSIISGSFVSLAALIGAAFFSSSAISAQVTIPVDTMPAKIEALKGDLVARLAQCEGGSFDEEDGLITYDNNAAGTLKGQNLPSIGLLQFKKGTVVAGYKQLYGEEISGKRAVEIALDKELSFQLAQDIIFSGKDAKGIDHWHNCNIKHGFAAEVAIIKKLER